jgi:hypothetical protein
MLQRSKEPPVKRAFLILPVTVVVLSFASGVTGKGKVQQGDKNPWEAVPLIPHAGEEQFRRMAFVSREVGYVLSNKAVYKTEDGCRTWKPVFEAPFLNTESYHYLHFTDAKHGWLGVNYSKVYFTEDGGETWQPLDEQVGAFKMAVGPGDWYIATGFEAHHKHGAKGKWEHIDLSRAIASPTFYYVSYVNITGPQSAFLSLNDRLQNRSRVLRTTDGGKSWKVIFSKDTTAVNGIQFVDAKRGWIVGGASIWTTEDAGDTWKAQINPEDKGLAMLAFASNSTFGVTTVSRYPKLVYTTNGKVWRSVEFDLKDFNFQDLCALDSGCAYVLCGDGRILRFLEPAKK